ncbi:hypothetical protein [Umezawaea tangerina]|uniref:DUF5642 domain-containing protein n=1 Tax=Umezawaea tangerina TaxID=84725 RepID=A0A2T0T9E7_9PSEU|nr:hypothetical protein [Umezawaea tangerina]PRY42297.1 hypothetical protein CLV43_104127 [Umezawaea tangerina]
MPVARYFPALLAMCAMALLACAAPKKPAAPPPQIPKIVIPTSVTRTPVMADRPIPDDCELIVPTTQVAQGIGQDLPGDTRMIIGLPEPSLGRTAKIDCYYGIPDAKPLPDAVVVVGISTYADEATAKGRVTESVDAERSEGAAVSEVDVGKQKASMIANAQERLVVGSLGKSTFVVRAKNGVLPDDKIAPVLAGFAAQSMTQQIS